VAMGWGSLSRKLGLGVLPLDIFGKFAFRIMLSGAMCAKRLVSVGVQNAVL